jgi:hypothetical protein
MGKELGCDQVAKPHMRIVGAGEQCLDPARGPKPALELRSE